MSTLQCELPVRRPDLVIRPLGENGRYVVKDPGAGSYFQLGEQEHFLLLLLDGAHGADAVCRKFEEQFAEPLSVDDLDGFIGIARRQRLLREELPPITPIGRQADEEFGQLETRRSTSPEVPSPAPSPPRQRQSLLYWRKSLFDPDRLCTWLEPRIRFFWTRGFLVLSAGCILLAVGLVWVERAQAATSALHAWRWETAVAVWLTIFVVTMLHEFAHGLTCKHYGGEVHEIGFLLMFFMPCFYCNVSDAWLFRERSKRLWVTFAGGYFELFLWALAVFVWRLTRPGSLVNYLAFIVFSACGVQTLFNFNPLLKLDGYYLLSDWLEIPNLKQRAVGYVKAHLRWLLWGAARPAPEPRRGALLAYGVLSWVYSILFLGLMLLGLGRLLGARWGIVGLGAVALLVVPSARNLLGGLTAGEVSTMFLKRHKRTALWLSGLAAMAAASFIQIEDRIGGECLLRPVTRAELRAPLAGFIAEVAVAEGERVSPGQCAIRLHVPDLESRIVQKSAGARESQSRLRLLEIGTRMEELVEQRQRVQRAIAWHKLAAEDLQHARQALVADLLRFDQASARSRAEVEAARHRFQRTEGLTSKGGVTKDEFEQAQLEMRVAELNGEQLLSARSALEAKGTRESEAELARREKELADESGKLVLMEAGARPEEVEAERARLATLQEELRYLQTLREKLHLASPVGGIITTPRLKEKIGQYVHEGDLICLIEEPAALQTEILLDEQQIERVEGEQRVRVKFRAIPLATYWGRVDQVAPAAVKEDERDPLARVRVVCRLDAVGPELRPGMTGYARISTGQRTIGEIVADRAVRLLRAEFWW